MTVPTATGRPFVKGGMNATATDVEPLLFERFNWRHNASTPTDAEPLAEAMDKSAHSWRPFEAITATAVA